MKKCIKSFVVLIFAVCLVFTGCNEIKKSNQIDDIDESETSIAENSNLDVNIVSDIIEEVTTKTPKNEVALSPDYNKLLNSEFGFEIEYPAIFEHVDSNSISANAVVYSASDSSAKLKICAGKNKGSLTPQQLCDEFIRIYGGTSEYNLVRDTWFAINLSEGDRHHYAYYSLKYDVIRGFEFHFSGDKYYDTYSKYIDYIYSSFILDFPEEEIVGYSSLEKTMTKVNNLREYQSKIEYYPEAHQTFVDVNLHKGKWYSIYIPAEDYSYGFKNNDNVIEESWTIENEFFTFKYQVNTYRNTEKSEARKMFEEANSAYTFEEFDFNSFNGMKGEENDYQNQYYMIYKVYSDEKNTYIIYTEYPAAAWEGFGILAPAVLETFRFENN